MSGYPHRHTVVASADVKNEHGVGMRVQIIQSYHGKPRWWLVRSYVQDGKPTGYRPPGDIEPSTQSEKVMTGWLARLPELAWDKYAFAGGERKVKKAEAAEAKFNQLVETYLRSMGATAPKDKWGDWRVQTKAGVLHVRPYGTWIAARFDDLPLAKKFVPGLGPHTAKWNFMFGDGAGEAEAADFAREVSRLLPSHGDHRPPRRSRSSRRRR
jgi:hypothetical protein